MFTQIYWCTKLSNKMRNVRKYRDCNIPIVVAAKQKRRAILSNSNDSGVSQPDVRKNYLHGVLHYLPKRPQSEDEVSINEYKNFMIKESAKKNKDIRALDNAMETTFADRRSLIVERHTTILQIKLEYPFLFQYQQVGVCLPIFSIFLACLYI